MDIMQLKDLEHTARVTGLALMKNKHPGEHTARVTGLALMKNKHLASISADKTIRLWDLTNMKPVFCMVEAHDTEIQCLEYCEERDELATCGMGNKVKIWDVKKPTHMKLKLKLDHADKSN
eukprot:gene178-3973_t